MKNFRKTVLDFYKKHGRHSLPWRHTKDPYKILVSEIMLQQTQVERVMPKYELFLQKFPTAEKLVEAKTADVLKAWQGLGYNRRALLLKRAAEAVMHEHAGKFPQSYDLLLKLPGIGPATAGDIMAFAYNKPAVVLETNIRQVFFHHYFPHMKERDGKACKIYDKDVAPLVEKTLDKKNPRDWYYALMDYGAYLKKAGNTISRSAHYTKQSKFTGSNRELRSQILKLVLKKPRTKAEVLKLLSSPAPAIEKNIIALEKEGLLSSKKGKISA
ncbi:A/G-specific adenine glycosylase [Candidatus Parcubacteria bacterium]|nr:A/G-specific adenine glycosylase [Candidatus Parcubacteria bacterium]